MNRHWLRWLYRIVWFWTTTLPLPYVCPAMNRRASGQHPSNGVYRLVLARLIGRCLLAQRFIAGRSAPITESGRIRAVYGIGYRLVGP